VLARIEALQSVSAAFENGGYEAVHKEYLERAERGDASAMVAMGLCHERGEGFAKDHQKAMDWYLKAFDKGEADAYNYIARLFRDGLGVSRDLEVACALHWIANRRRFGSFAANARLDRGLSDLHGLLSEEQIQACRKMSEAYVNAYVRKRGNLTDEEKLLKFAN
jgi:hypothetical protein